MSRGTIFRQTPMPFGGSFCTYQALVIRSPNPIPSPFKSTFIPEGSGLQQFQDSVAKPNRAFRVAKPVLTSHIQHTRPPGLIQHAPLYGPDFRVTDIHRFCPSHLPPPIARLHYLSGLPHLHLVSCHAESKAVSVSHVSHQLLRL